MAISRAWDEANPAAAQFVSTGPGYFQNHQIDIRERMQNGGVVWNNGTKDFDGLHAVGAGVAGNSPDIFKSDLVTKILAWADANATLLAAYKIIGSKNIPEVTMDDESIGIDAKGIKRANQAFRIAESSPVDTKVNIRAGVYIKSPAIINQIGTPTYYAGGQLTIGVAPLTLPAAGNHAAYVVVLDRTGTLTARKGTEVIFANPIVLPALSVGDNPIGVLDIRTDSVNFSLVAASPNAFLSSDMRTDVSHLIPDVALTAAQNNVVGAEAATTRLSKSITTSGGVVLAMGGCTLVAYSSTPASIGRAGVPLATSAVGIVIGAEAIAAGTYTYLLKTAASGVGEWMVLLELPTAVIA